MGKCIDRGYRGAYVEITICRDCYHQDVCETGGYLEQNECSGKIARDRILELPCKIGDTIYFLIEEINGVDDFISDEVITDMSTKGIFVSSYDNNTEPVAEDFGNFTPYEKLGKTVFLTQAEAEKALEVLNND